MLASFTLSRRPSLKARRRQSHILQCAILVCFVFLLFHHSTTWPSLSVSSTNFVARRNLDPLTVNQAAFWRDLSEAIIRHGPTSANPPEHVIPYELEVQFNPGKHSIRPDLLWIDHVDIRKMRDAHTDFVRALGEERHKLVYTPGTRGIVMTATYKSLPVLVISIRMIRRTGSLLPVEVFLNSADEYNSHVCEHILPSLNSRCIIIQDILEHAGPAYISKSHQLKSFATLFSSFEDLLVLDTDAFPIQSPDDLFNTSPFDIYGMITWPDFWYPSESPYYFEIAQIESPPDLNIHPSTASGQFMISKSKHSSALLLAAYYNFHGPTYYYPLLSQNGPGSHDKETFPWAATIMSEGFYVVDTPVLAAGHFDSNDEWIGSAMVQYDPVEDFSRSGISSNNTSLGPKPLFIHANHPSFDPSVIFNDEINGAKSPVRDSNGGFVRAWNWTATTTPFVTSNDTESDPFDLYGVGDIERMFWQEIKYMACHYEGVFGIWKDRKKERVCVDVKKYMQKVFR